MKIETIPQEPVYWPDHSIEEVENLYQFKVLRRAILDELIWTKDVFVDHKRYHDELNLKWKRIPIAIEIEPKVLCYIHNWTIPDWIETCYEHNLEYDAEYLAQFCSGSYSDTLPVMNMIGNIITQNNSFRGFPADERLMTGNTFKVGSFYFNRGKLNWDTSIRMKFNC